MKAFFGLVLTLLAVLASAQYDPMAMQRDMLTSPAMMMAQPDFKKELKLTKEQDKKISDISKAHQKKMSQLTGQTSRDDLASGVQMMKDMQVAQDEANKAILVELNPEQTRRLRQLQWQILGPKALYELDLQKELALTEEQTGKVNEHRDGAAERSSQTMLNNQGVKLSAAMKKLREENEKTLLGFLTAEQVAKYKEALGPLSKAAKRVGDLIF